MSQNGRPRFGLWMADHALALGGLALVALGATGVPMALPLGWAALAVALFAWVAEAEGIAVPRPGRVAIRPLGCWDTPLAFTVRRGRQVLLFTREEREEDGGWSDTYTVRQQAGGKTERLSLSFRELVKGEVAGALWLRPGDVLYVP